MNGLATGSELPTNPHPTSLHEATFSTSVRRIRPPLKAQTSPADRLQRVRRHAGGVLVQGWSGWSGQEFFMGGEGGLNKRERPPMSRSDEV